MLEPVVLSFLRKKTGPYVIPFSPVTLGAQTHCHTTSGEGGPASLGAPLLGTFVSTSVPPEQ